MTFYLKCVLQLLRLVYVVKRQIRKKEHSECKTFGNLQNAIFKTF